MTDVAVIGLRPRRPAARARPSPTRPARARRRQRRRAPGRPCATAGCRSRSPAPRRSSTASTIAWCWPSASPTPRRPTHIVITLGTPSFSHIEIDMRDIRSVLDDLLPAPARRPHARAALDDRAAARPSSSPATSPSTAASTIGEDVFVAHAPERIAAGRFFEEIATLPCIVGGVGERSGEVAARAVRASSARRSCRRRPVAGRAGEDLDEHPALRDVRAAQPADDGLRAVRRERLRGHRPHQPRLPARRDRRCRASPPGRACARTSRSSEERSNAPGMLLAVSRVNESVPLFLVEGAEAPPRLAARAQGRGPRPGVQGRHRRRARLARRTSSSACSSASSPTSRSTTRTSRRRRSPSRRRCWTPTRSSSRPTTPSSAAARSLRAIADSGTARRARRRPVELLAAPRRCSRTRMRSWRWLTWGRDRHRTR